MKAIIVGAGFTGVELAQKLIDEKWDVVLIDRREESLRAAGAQLDCAVVSSDGNSLEVLESSGVATTDALIAVTEDDETNLMICALVDAVYPRVRTIARVRNDVYYSKTLRRIETEAPRRLLGVDHMVRPNAEVSAALVRAVTSGAVGDVVDLCDDWIVLCVTIGEGSPLSGLPLRRLSEVEGWRFLVAYVMASESATLPDGSTELHVGDRIGVLVRRPEVAALLTLAHVTPVSTRRLAVYGAERIGQGVVEGLRRAGGRSPIWSRLLPGSADRRDLILVDPDPERCVASSDAFRDVRVICGDLTEESVVDEESLDGCGLIIAASSNYDRNLIVAAYMKSRGVPKTVALTESSAVAGIARKLGVDVVVPMRETVVDNIMGCLRGRNVLSVHTLCNGACELVTCTVEKGSAAEGRALKEVARAGEYLLLLVRPRSGEATFMPHGETVLSAGDELTLIARDGRESVRIFTD